MRQIMEKNGGVEAEKKVDRKRESFVLNMATACCVGEELRMRSLVRTELCEINQL